MSSREFSPIIDVESNDDVPESLFVKRRFCFCIPYGSDNSAAAGLKSLWSSGVSSLKKLREWSEIVAGPRWKTFIRRFNRNKSGGSNKYQYDPLSYALNFDEGPAGDPVEVDEYLARNFSARYATVSPGLGRGSMDLGKEGPSFS
ncbi:hypothetical protein DCAR_0729998 [Daucus carota subsp. sativus]|uniref:Uncharacterized protein n=1 Tax=Daucus carota subsp. sativus TaxID=79200 RepID=A0A164ULL3_DAUCS|nr:PREDICTED: uncharacterized protein LOC108195030 [Daucus carota subsp. sativus]WOH10529.1 hypothetical protein DCAR_0729998 [Daucus carota subsp. sativus]